MAKRLVVIGGGISGLAAAHAAAAETEGVEIVVLERASEVGGRCTSLQEDGWLVEGGPGGYLDTEPSVVDLVHRAGIEEELVRAEPGAARRFIYRSGRLHEIGPSLLKPLRSGLLGIGGLLRAAGEPVVPRRSSDGEESILEFCRRRFGRQVAERIVHTAMLGIFAGDAARLSVDACFPELRQLEREHGSVLRGALARRRARRRQAAENGALPSRRLTSFRGGLQQLPLALARDARIDVRTRAAVVGVRRLVDTTEREGHKPGGYVLEIHDAAPLRADAVVVATPVQVASRLFAELSPEAGRLLGQVPVPPVAVVALGFAEPAASQFPPGFGVLVSRGEGVRMLGCLWESHIYPGRSPEGSFLARAMFGGGLDPAVADLDDERLLALARSELSTVLGIDAAPVFSRIVRWPHAIPQYEIGHLAIVQRVRSELSSLPGVFLAGDALEGVSFPKTATAGIRQGTKAARHLADL